MRPVFLAVPLIMISGAGQAKDENTEVITITATPLAARVSDIASSVSNLTGDEKRRKQSLSLGDTLADEAGISNMSTGAQAGKPVIRGLSGNRIRILADSVAQDHQQYGVRHIPNLDPFLANRIEVVRGPMSVLYGADAIGGVINLISLPVPHGADGLALLRLTSQYQSNNDARMLGLETTGAQGEWGWSSALSHHSAGNLHTPNTATYPQDTNGTAPKFAGALPYTNYRVTDGTLAIGYEGQHATITSRYSVWDNHQNYLQPDGRPTGQHLVNSNLLTTIHLALPADWQLKSTLNWQYNSRDAGTGITFEQLDEYNRDLAIRMDRYSTKIAVVHPAFGPWQGEWGLDLLYKRQTTPVGTLVPNARERNQALYLYEQAQFGDIYTQLGIRYDHSNLTPANNAYTQLPDLQTQRWRALSGSIGATWAFQPHWYLAMNLARGFRTPSIFELYANGIHGGVAAVQVGNAALKEEYSFNKDIGLRFIDGEQEASLTYFHNTIIDYIYQANSGQTDTRTGLPIYMITQGDAALSGVEASLQWPLTSTLRLRVNYTAINGVLSHSQATLPLLPADTANAELRWQLGQLGPFADTQAHLGYKHSWAKSAAGLYEPFSQYDQLPFGTASTPAYQLWNLGVSGQYALGKQTLEVRVKVSNLLNSRYRDFLDTYKGYTLGMGRNISTTVTWTF